MVLGSEKYAEMGSNEVQIHFTVLKYIFLVSILYCTMNVSDITFTHFYTNICTFYFYTLTWVKKCSQYFNFYQSIFKHEYLDKDVVLLPSLERTNIGSKWHGELNCHHKELQCGRALLDLWKQISQIMFWIWKGIAYLI